MKQLTDHINHLGFRQYRVEGPYEDIDVCPECRTKYVNQGEGVICSNCAESDRPNDEQK